jgi:hypothetical protein
MVVIVNTGIILLCVTYCSHFTIMTNDFIILLTKLMLFTWNFISDGDLSFACFPCSFQFSWYYSFWLTSAIEIDSDDGVNAQMLISLKTNSMNPHPLYTTFLLYYFIL